MSGIGNLERTEVAEGFPSAASGRFPKYCPETPHLALVTGYSNSITLVYIPGMSMHSAGVMKQVDLVTLSLPITSPSRPYNLLVST